MYSLDYKVGDCLDLLKEVEDGSIDLVCTDPPYGISFMGKNWDKAVPSMEVWQECLRVLKPGAFAFIMSSPRMDVLGEMERRIRGAGFRTDFTPIYWGYASGFPKAMNISKAVDKKFGAERKIIDYRQDGVSSDSGSGIYELNNGKSNMSQTIAITCPATPQAKALDGSYGGFQPKPAVEVIIVAMKPLSEKTYTDQALENGKGITWLDDCRIPYQNEDDIENATPSNAGEPTTTQTYGWKDCTPIPAYPNNKGRFPANLLVSDDVLNDGTISKSSRVDGSTLPPIGKNGVCGHYDVLPGERGYDDSGSFSRYFDLDAWFAQKIKDLPDEVRKTFPFLIVPKAATGEKNEGLETFGLNKVNDGRQTPIDNPFQRGETLRKNIHPTVKPVALMSYLITLGSREGDLVLDPFVGSGTTLVACRLMMRRGLGFEISDKYAEIIKARINSIPQPLDVWGGA